ncbi:tricarballylate dehydrogenase [Streptomyces abyssalis]|uniref:Tricarballylate dehydrogenase n=1 Tax=Streptomyces abyssalis TaxID=933944 RepID=A0A1E7JQ27_9ACTN|nr:FAD-dependent tricarballylate dehydrogenase TcuA [Streptomyces abyssalis]OEU90389.1 tricarballylate dehydrogenase [Streptomyces abyssalis]OEU95126.1 tricarballylate dehydrogenase [Streptomyces abyssalis]
MAGRRVIVVGAGNAALCAALAASEQGAEVLVLERAPERLRGGNTAFTAGAMRVVYSGVEDLRKLMPDLTPEEIGNTDFGSYTAADYLDDLARVTEYRTDPELASTLVEKSLPTLLWMSEKGVRFVPIYGRQAFKVDGRFTFWGGLTVEASGGGMGLVESLTRAAVRAGIRIEYGARVLGLLQDDGGGVRGVTVRQAGQTRDEHADAVVLASGGFQSSPEMRARYLGPGWDLAKVRGTMYNTGDGLRMALRAGASPAGNWSGCHAVGWDRNAPEFGDLAVGDHFQKHSYPWGVMVNAHGRRFVDEGADFRNYTYAKYGRVILEQPGQFAWQVFDQKVTHLLRDEYRIRQITKVTAPSLTKLAEKMDGVDPAGFVAEMETYNASVDTGTPFNPNVRDGRGTAGLAVDKTNWANTVDEGPFEAYAVTCGITFTFGGVRIVPESAQVLDADMNPISGLFAAGELVGGLFYFNYPGGTGLTNGSVFGRIAGTSAGRAG